MFKNKYFLLSIRRKALLTFYLILILSLFFYSYTQVDLNLTLSRITIWRQIQTSFQYIGWFQRPLSTMIFSVIYLLLTTFYLLLIFLVIKHKINHKQLWWLIIPTSLILLFSYNAFSYDLFNYLFDARIITFYHQNPYLHKALDYPLDPWINFMRWTHRTYPYGPVWLAMTVPLSFIGFQIFLPTLFLFKGLMAAGFLGTIYYLGKIMQKLNPEKKLLAMTLFAFNPLIIIELLISAHNDIVMICLAVMSFYFLLQRRILLAFLLLLLSVGIKFATVFLLPVFILYTLSSLRGSKADEVTANGGIPLRRDNLKTRLPRPDVTSGLAMTGMIMAIVFASLRTEFQPWYLIWVLPFVFLSAKKWLITLSIIISLGVMTQYLPFLYTGNWDQPIPLIKTWIISGSVILGSLSALVVVIKERKVLK